MLCFATSPSNGSLFCTPIAQFEGRGDTIVISMRTGNKIENKTNYRVET